MPLNRKALWEKCFNVRTLSRHANESIKGKINLFAYTPLVDVTRDNALRETP